MEKVIHNWTYTYDEESGFDVIPDKKIEKPQVLYKLYAFSDNSFDALINQYVYATHPFQLNDIFDCNEELIEFDDENVVRQFFSPMVPTDKLEKYIKSKGSNIKVSAQRLFKEIVYKKWGIFSLTNNPNNVLMWAYYGNHKGFCVEFDITKFTFEYYGPFPVNYQTTLEAISLKEVGTHIGVLAQSNLKDAAWKHEDEWRLMIAAPKGEDMLSKGYRRLEVLGGHNRKFQYDISAIKSIALGNRFFEPGEIIIVNDDELRITLTSNFERKSIMLDFLYTNQIETHLGMRSGFTQIKFRSVRVERIDYRTYKLLASS